jgi:hypothetical protein
MKIRIVIVAIVIIALVLAFKVYGFPNTRCCSDKVLNPLHRFLLGLFDGIISIFSLIASFFNKCINIYSIRDASAEYNIGYIFGVWLLFGGALSFKKED